MEKATGPPIPAQLLKMYTEKYCRQRTKDVLGLNKDRMDHYSWNMCSDFGTMFASFGIATCEFRNVNTTLNNRPKLHSIIEGFNDAVATC